MERVDRDADDRRVEVRGEIQRLAECRDDGTVGDIHRMQRLDRERDTGGRSIRSQLPQRIAHALARTDDVAGTLGEPSGDEHEDRRGALRTRCGERRGLFDRATVVIDR